LRSERGARGPDPAIWSGLNENLSGIPIDDGGCHEAQTVRERTNEQIAFALRQAKNGTSVEEVCRKLGVSEATFYRWKKQFAGMGVVGIRRLRQLEEENAKLKRLVADLSLDKTMLQDVLRGPPFFGARPVCAWAAWSGSTGLPHCRADRRA
jgi:putative transposase